MNIRYTLLLLATLFLSLPSQAQLLDKLNASIESNPKDSKGYIERAQYYISNNHYRSAIRDIDIALELNPKIIEAYISRGLAKFKLEDISGAINDYNRAIYYDPKHAKAYYLRGKVRQEEDPKGACDDFTKATTLGYPVESPISCP